MIGCYTELSAGQVLAERSCGYRDGTARWWRAEWSVHRLATDPSHGPPAAICRHDYIAYGKRLDRNFPIRRSNGGARKKT